MAFKKNGPGCCPCEDPPCDGVSCSVSFGFNPTTQEVTLNWSASATESTHKINSIVVNGVQQLDPGEEVYSASGTLGPWPRGATVPASATITVTNTCGNTCENVVEPDCCLRTTVSYLEIAGFNSLYSYTCTYSDVTEKSEIIGIDGLNGTYTKSAQALSTGCWQMDLPVTTAGQLFVELQSSNRHQWTRYYGNFELDLSGLGANDIVFRSTSFDFYYEVNGSVWSQGTATETNVFTLATIGAANDPDTLTVPQVAGCITPPAFGTAIELVPLQVTSDACVSSFLYPRVCTGQDGISAATGRCYFDSGQIRRWLGN